MSEKASKGFCHTLWLSIYKWASASKDHIFLGLILLISLIYYYIDVFNNLYCVVHVEIQYSGYIVNTNNCKIPALDPYDFSILEYYAVETKKDCYDGKPLLIGSNLTHIFINSTALKAQKYTIENLDCCYLPFVKKFPPTPDVGSVNLYGDECLRFSKGFVVHHDKILVECAYKGVKVYKDVFSFVPKPVMPATTEGQTITPNVIIFGLDGLSRSNFHRHMKKTEDVLDEIEAIEMFGYHKVAVNSFPNLLALLTGMTRRELKKHCWPMKWSLMDSCPFIWKDFEARGYTTAYVEDSYYQASFDYPYGGFSEQPTDYFWRPFVPVTPLLKPELKDNNKTVCIGARRLFDITLEYFDKFTQTMSSTTTPYFLFFWSEAETHFYLNTPSLIDEEVAKSLNNLHTSGGLNNTILLFISDHGHRFGTFRQSYQGFLEDKLPVLYIYLPQWFQENYPKQCNNLKQHNQLLTTPFDIYETLIDLLHIKVGFLKGVRKGLGQSLLITPIEDRSCESAGIDPLHCACLLPEEEVTTSADIPEAAKLIVDHINNKLGKEEKCAKISLEDVIRAQKVTPEMIHFVDYVVVVGTQPGNATYEAMVRRENFKAGYEMRIMDDIIRTSLYGGQSDCVEEESLKPYCYCIEQNATMNHTTQ